MKKDKSWNSNTLPTHLSINYPGLFEENDAIL